MATPPSWMPPTLQPHWLTVSRHTHPAANWVSIFMPRLLICMHTLQPTSHLHAHPLICIQFAYSASFVVYPSPNLHTHFQALHLVCISMPHLNAPPPTTLPSFTCISQSNIKLRPSNLHTHYPHLHLPIYPWNQVSSPFGASFTYSTPSFAYQHTIYTPQLLICMFCPLLFA